MLKDFPEDIILNISSFLLGERHLYKIKRNPTLKAIQDKYKIEYEKPDVFGGYGYFPIGMTYGIRSQNLKPHMINSPKNITRIVNFINTFQYGYPDDDDFDFKNPDDVERHNSLFELDEGGQDEIDVEYPEILEIKLTLSSEWRCHYTSHILGGVYTEHFKKTYVFENFTKVGFTRAFALYILDIPDFERRHQDAIRHLRNFRIEVEIFKRFDSDSESDSDDN